MGADGGSLPVRSEQIKKKQQEARTDPLQRARMRLSLCALSSRPLDKSTENIACDMHGNLFSLEEVLSSLLDAEKKKSLKSVFGIKRMKDLTVLKATINPEYLLISEDSDEFVAPFLCPFTQELSNGVTRFVVIRPCGHVMSQSALKELSSIATMPHQATTKDHSASIGPSSVAPNFSSLTATEATSTEAASLSSTCLSCSTSYKPEDVIDLPSASSSTSLEENSRNPKKRDSATASDTPTNEEEAIRQVKKSKR